MKNIKKSSKVTLIELPATQFGELEGMGGYDIYSMFKLPSRALHSLEAVLRNEGWTDVRSLNPIHHGKNGRFTAENLSRIYTSDIIGVSAITRTSPSSRALVRRYKSINPDGIAIAGGFDPTFQTERWFEESNVDAIVIGEGERTLKELMHQFTLDKDELAHIPGLAIRDGSGIIYSQKRALLTGKELSTMPLPYLDEEVRRSIGISTLETSRGCPNQCTYCTVTQFNGGKYRMKSPEWVIGALKSLQEVTKYLFIIDDNFAASHRNTKEILTELSDRGLNKMSASAQVDVKIAEDQQLLEAFKRANIRTFYIGVESINPKSLEYLHKPFSAEQNKRCIQILRENRFWIHGMMMVGSDADSLEDIEEAGEWAKENFDSVQFFAPTPIPGSELRNKMTEEGRILPVDDSLYDGQMVVYKPKNMSPLQLQEKIYQTLDDFYSPKNMIKRFGRSPDKGLSLGIGYFLHVMKGRKNLLYSPQVQQHLEYLRKIS